MRVLFAASESTPFCKTGGLADVIGSLPEALRKKRHDVRAILPRYRAIRFQEFGLRDTGLLVHVAVGESVQTGRIFTAGTEKGIPFYFIDHEGYFGRSGLYQGPLGDYPDNDERFIFFCKAVLEACKAVDFQPDILHGHDWQTGLIPAYLKTQNPPDAFFQHTATMFTIHNMAYQGIFPKSALTMAGLPEREFTFDKLEFYGHLNFLKAGLVYSNRLTTVSPTYAQEIQGSAESGGGLEGVLRHRSRDLTGIINGLDLEAWDPGSDPFLAKPFNAESLKGRADCKAALQQNLMLPQLRHAPLLGMVARLNWQKGVDLLVEIIPNVVASGAQVVVLGNGDPALQRRLEELEAQFPGAFRVCSDFNEPLAHHIYGGCDLYLMPSRFEPCGLGQMIAMRYGAVPVVMCTGGLRDTVTPIGPKDSGTGFVFYDPTPESFFRAIWQGLILYADAEAWSRLQDRVMRANFSWDASAQAYLNVYRQARGSGVSPRKSARRVH